MEISAVLDAVRSLEGPLEVVSDSTYVVNAFRDRWWEGWLARGWKNSQKKDVANRDLWEPLIDAYRADPSRFRLRWVKGHSGDAMNDLVDRLAVEAATTQKARSGTGTPALLGPADRLRTRPKTGAASEGHEPPKGYLIAVTGVRPPALGGYGDTPAAVTARRMLTEILEAKAQVEPETTVLTGLGLGIEQLAAEAAEAAGVPYVAVLAFPGQERAWPEASRTRFDELVADAAEVRTLQQRAPTSKQTAAGAFSRRDAWIARAAAEAIVVWDGKDAAIGKALRSLQDHLGEEQVWVVEP
jgi:uncharacterized phage-like protein YoqJ